MLVSEAADSWIRDQLPGLFGTVHRLHFVHS